jgi:YesN/AraC family two-component response regulator
MNHFTIYHYYFGEQVRDEKTRELYQKMFAYLFANMDRRISLSDLATEFNYSESFVSKFMKKFGLNFQSRLAYLRSMAVEKNILATDKNLLELATEYGFSDVRYLCRAIERTAGEAVSTLRAKYRSSDASASEQLETKEIRKYLPTILEAHYCELFMPV